MQTLRIGKSTYKLSPSRDVGELQAKFAKCTGKYKRSTLRADPRKYPQFTPDMSTADYVRAFYAFNFGNHGAGSFGDFFAPLNTAPCTLYSGEDLHEIIEDAAPLECAAVAPAECAAVPEVQTAAAEAPASPAEPAPILLPTEKPAECWDVTLTRETELPTQSRGERQFAVIVTRPKRRGMIYPPMAGGAALALLERMHARGHDATARTTANDITEDVTLAHMRTLYGDPLRGVAPAAPSYAIPDAVPPATQSEDFHARAARADAVGNHRRAEVLRELAADRALHWRTAAAPAIVWPDFVRTYQRTRTAMRAGAIPLLRIPGNDLRRRVPAHFAPVYLLA